MLGLGAACRTTVVGCDEAASLTVLDALGIVWTASVGAGCTGACEYVVSAASAATSAAISSAEIALPGLAMTVTVCSFLPLSADLPVNKPIAVVLICVKGHSGISRLAAEVDASRLPYI